MLSCRALGKDVEQKLALWLHELTATAGADRIDFDFRLTFKNHSVHTFLKTLGVTIFVYHLSGRVDSFKHSEPRA